MNVRHNRLRVRRKTGRLPLSAAAAARGRYGGGLCDRLLLRRQCCAAGAVKSGSFLFEQQRRGWDAVRRLADRAVRLVRLRFCDFLLLSTSYLGFFADSGRFSGSKDFLSACTAAAFLNSGCDHAFWLSCVAVGLPGIFLVPALFLLGTLCAQMSVRLLEQRRGLPVPVSSERYSRELALVFCLLLAAAAAACYAVPFSHGLFCDLWSLWMKSDWKGGSRHAGFRRNGIVRVLPARCQALVAKYDFLISAGYPPTQRISARTHGCRSWLRGRGRAV